MRRLAGGIILGVIGKGQQRCGLSLACCAGRLVKVREAGRWTLSESAGTLTIRRLRTTDAGSYRCVVNSLAYPPIASSPALLTVRGTSIRSAWPARQLTALVVQLEQWAGSVSYVC